MDLVQLRFPYRDDRQLSAQINKLGEKLQSLGFRGISAELHDKYISVSCESTLDIPLVRRYIQEHSV